MGSIEQRIAVGIINALMIPLRASPLMINRDILRSRVVTQLNRELPLCMMVILIASVLADSTISNQPGMELITPCGVTLTFLMWQNSLLSVVTGIGGPALLRSLL